MSEHTIPQAVDPNAERLIPLSGKRGLGLFTRVSAHRYETLSQYKWHLATQRGYVARQYKINGQRYMMYMHREIMDCPHGSDIDHADGDHLNNTDNNLRIATRSQNNANAIRRHSEHASSQYRGVMYDSCRNQWIAQIQCHGKNYYIGVFATEIDAARARDGAAIVIHGAFAKLNVPHLNPIPFVPRVPRTKLSQYPGVTWKRDKGKWRAFTTVNRRFKHLGYFDTEKEAYDAFQIFQDSQRAR